MLDRLTIMDLKRRHAGSLSVGKLEALLQESHELTTQLKKAMALRVDGETLLVSWYGELSQLNSQLWDVEDEIRRMIRNGTWAGPESAAFTFQTLLVPYLNDRRSAKKAQINEIMHPSGHTEFKVYS